MTRMKSYNDKTSPILDYYKSRGILATLNASAAIKTVSSEIDAALKTNRQ